MKKLNIITIALLGFTGASFAQTYSGLTYPKPEVNQNKVEEYKIEKLMSNNVGSETLKDKFEVSEMRKQVLIDTANALGASAGLNAKLQVYKKLVDKRANELDEKFDFTKRIIDNGVLAPVFIESFSNYTQDTDNEVRISDKIYKIDSSAKFVSVYPTWRSYLKFSYGSFNKPPTSYLPQNETENLIWDNAIKEGWKNGEIQASKIFMSSFAKLERDYLGMGTYKILLAQGITTPTMIAKENFGVTGGGKEMAINDQIFRITDQSALNPDKKEWKVEYPVSNQTNGVLK